MTLDTVWPHRVCLIIVMSLSLMTVALFGRLSMTAPPTVLADDAMTTVLKNKPDDLAPHQQSPGVDLRLFKVDAEFGQTAPAGGVVEYILAYNNFGTVTATNVLITETLPAHTTFNPTISDKRWQAVPNTNLYRIVIGDVPPGGNPTNKGGFVIFGVTIDAPLPDGVTEITNEAIVSSAQPDSNPADNRDTERVKVQNVLDVRLAKQSQPSTAVQGQLIRYTLAYSNSGSKDLRGIVITETVPAHTTFNLANSSAATWQNCPDGALPGTVCTANIGGLNVGASGSAIFAVRIDNNLPLSVTQISNRATIADDGSQGVDSFPNNNLATVVLPRPVPEVDLQLTKSDGGTVALRGQRITYTLRYLNDGNIAANGVVITETLPQFTQFVGPPPWQQVGSSRQYRYEAGAVANGVAAAGSITFVVRVEPTTPDSVTSIINHATISDDGLNGRESDPNNNTIRPVITVLTATPPLTGGPDLSVIKVDGGAIAQPGGLLTYGFIYANSGNRLASGVTLSELLPPQTHFVSGTAGWRQVGSTNQYLFPLPSDVPAGFFSRTPLTLTVRVDDPAPNLLALNNVVTIQDDGQHGAEQNPADNLFTLTTRVTDTRLPDLQLDKSDGGIIGKPGERLTYRLTVQNVGTQEAGGVVITETVPNDTTFDFFGSLPTLWRCPNGATAGTVCITRLPKLLAVGEVARLRFVVRVRADLPDNVPVQIINQARVSDDGLRGRDPTPTNNQDRTMTTIATERVPQQLYLPLIVQGRDLRVAGVTVSNTRPRTGESVEIRVRLQNSGPSVSEPFWVDLYLARQPIQPTVNRSWSDGFDPPKQTENRIVPHGVVWRVYGMPANGTVERTNLSPNDPRAPQDNFSNFIPNNVGQWGKFWNGIPLNNHFREPGTYYLYVLVDSLNQADGGHGAVVETNEQNNLFGPLIITVHG